MINRVANLIIAKISTLFCVVPLLLCCLFISSCGNGTQKDDAYYDTLFAATNKALSHEKRLEAILRLDSLYRKTNAPTPYFQFLRFESLHYYNFDHWDLATAKIMRDSQIYVMERYNLKDKYPKQYAHVLGDRGNFYFGENSLDKAFEFYSRSRAVILTIKDNECLLSDQSYRIAMVYYRQEKYNEAAAYFKESIREMKRCQVYDSDSYYRQQELYSNAALSYSKARVLDSALQYFKDALKIIDTEGVKYDYSNRFRRLSRVAKGVLYGNLAKVYIASGNSDTAELLLLKSIAINSQIGYDNHDVMYSNMQLSELYYNTGKYEKAVPILGNLRLKLDTVPNPDVNLRWYHLMYKMSRHFHKPDEGIKYLEGYYGLKDSADAKLNKLKKSDYAGLLKDQETQYQIKLLKKDNKYNRLYLGFTVGLALIAVIIIVMIYDNYRRSRRNVLQLTSLNTQVNEQKAQLEDAMGQLKINNEDKDKILRIVAHDLRTPIGGIITLSDIMVEEEEDKPKRESLKMIMSASRNLMHLTNELMEFSGNRGYVTPVEKEETEINDLARQAVTLLQFKANGKQQNIVLNQLYVPVSLYIVREKINRVLNNLITNAIKFSNNGATITVTVERPDTSVRIKVQDNGIGIPEEFIPLLFDPFTNAKRRGTAGERSFGLGLSICRQIMDDHGGKIWVESVEGEGSMFFIELPLF